MGIFTLNINLWNILPNTLKVYSNLEIESKHL